MKENVNRAIDFNLRSQVTSGLARDGGPAVSSVFRGDLCVCNAVSGAFRICAFAKRFRMLSGVHGGSRRVLNNCPCDWKMDRPSQNL